MTDVWVRLGIIIVVLACLLLALPGRRLTRQTGGLAGETQQIHLYRQRVHLSRKPLALRSPSSGSALRSLRAAPRLSGGAGALESRIGRIRAVGLLAQAAGARAEDLALLRQERLPQQRALAAGTAEATLGGVPVLPVIRHLALVDACEKPTWMVLKEDGIFRQTLN